ncbi:hypothetical protein A33O_12874 [Nitratireductor aquibiodomus RA22]|uniref:Uncharacterized protein n=1 Tax=Nitratireductor aquibiodomus RA22 TaxID=1189611 RepID=I5BXG8_9HYPH|nr:hypothetical protein [Nitratireductor aquibiodomus]EIM74270.1 hypothetical protein A33O_12874 [Nitratireductor aquibiodomus RA22]
MAVEQGAWIFRPDTGDGASAVVDRRQAVDQLIASACCTIAVRVDIFSCFAQGKPWDRARHTSAVTVAPDGLSTGLQGGRRCGILDDTIVDHGLRGGKTRSEAHALTRYKNLRPGGDRHALTRKHRIVNRNITQCYATSVDDQEAVANRLTRIHRSVAVDIIQAGGLFKHQFRRLIRRYSL